MRTVYTSRELPHIYASGKVPHGRNQRGSLSFQGPDIYSYYTRVGSIYTVGPKSAPARVLLLTDRNYSVTTAKQLGMIASAWHGNGLLVRVPDLGGGYGAIGTAAHRHNLAAFRLQIDGLVAKASARVHAEWHLTAAADLASTARRYCAAFKISARKFPESEVAELRAAANDPELRAAAVRAAADREAKRTAAERAERRRVERELVALDAKRRAAWLSGDRSAVPPRGGAICCRVIENESGAREVETSHGARVEITAARALYAALHRGETAALVGRPIGHYTVARVESDRIVIGCHVLTFAEVERLAIAAGFAISPPLATPATG